MPKNQIKKAKTAKIKGGIQKPKIDLTGKKVVHDQKKQEFVLDTGAGKVRLQYQEEGDGVTDFYHTFTPKKLRGQNLAAVVTKVAFEHALSAGLKVRPSCSYLTDTFLPKHQEFQSCIIPASSDETELSS